MLSLIASLQRSTAPKVSGPDMQLADSIAYLQSLMAYGTGELAIGDVDSAHYAGELRYLSVLNMVSSRMGYWEVKMDAWNIGGIAIGNTNKTVMDSGTSLFAVPSDAIKVLAKAVGAMEVLPTPPSNC